MQGTGRWPEKTSGGPEGRFHPPELRETTCAVALKWLLTHGVDGADSIASGGRGADNNKGRDGARDGDGEGDGSDGSEQGAEAMVERALEYRKCGRELFTRLLASGKRARLGGGGPWGCERVCIRRSWCWSCRCCCCCWCSRLCVVAVRLLLVLLLLLLFFLLLFCWYFC